MDVGGRRFADAIYRRGLRWSCNWSGPRAGCTSAFRSSSCRRADLGDRGGTGGSFSFRSDASVRADAGGSFNNSSGEQKAGLLNQLMGSMNPAMLSQVLGGAGLGSLLAAGGGKVTPEQAQNISPDAMQQIAAHAEKTNPSIVDSVSSFYAQHTGWLKAWRRCTLRRTGKGCAAPAEGMSR